jgi:VWFA-related protein
MKERAALAARQQRLRNRFVITVMVRATLKFGILLVVLASYAPAQTNASDAGQTTLRTTTTLVVVPALVQTPAKELVFSLTADDFTLTDNGVPQKVTLEADTTRPLSLVVLIQTGGAAYGQFENYTHLETMLAAVLGNPPNKVSIVNFDSHPEAASPFTSDIAQWSDAINHPDPGDKGAAIFDGLSFALNLLKQQPPNNRRAILLISQEHDGGSKTPLKEIIRTLGETNTAVYSITFSSEETAFKQAFKDPPHLNKPWAVGDGVYQAYFNLSEPLGLALGAMRKNLSAEIAALSGGESISFDNKVQLDEDLGVLNNHIRNSYVLSFYPTSNEPGLHTIKVGLAHHPELVVTARGSYWAADSAKTETTVR